MGWVNPSRVPRLLEQNLKSFLGCNNSLESLILDFLTESRELRTLVSLVLNKKWPFKNSRNFCQHFFPSIIPRGVSTCKTLPF